MSTTVNDLEKTVNSGLTTTVKKSEINLNQLFIDVDVEDVISTILFLKTNEKCKFKQLIDITAVDYPQREKRFKIVYLLLSHENNLRIIININVEEKYKKLIVFFTGSKFRMHLRSVRQKWTLSRENIEKMKSVVEKLQGHIAVQESLIAADEKDHKKMILEIIELGGPNLLEESIKTIEKDD